jgi:hypothetical protein
VDTPRRWQVASLATAVTSLGIGGLLVSRPSVEPLQPIVLDVPTTADANDLPAPLDPIELDDDGGTDPIGADVVTPQTPASLESVSSPAEPTAPASSPSPSPSPTTTSSPASSRSAPAEADDSPDSIDSVDSLDSDD